MNYTDEQIIKAEKIIKDLHTYCFCSQNVFKTLGYNFTENDFNCLHNVIDEVKRLKAENERLNSLCASKDVIINDLNAEVERLKPKCEDCAGCSEWKCDCSNIRKEFAERLKDECSGNPYLDDYVLNKCIDNLLEEMENQ